MAIFCQTGQSPSVRITAQSNTQTLNFGNAPIDIEQSGTNQNGKCWEFYSTNNGVLTDVFFAFGQSAYYQPDSSLMNGGAWLYVDGKNVAGTTNYYWEGTFGGIVYRRYIVSTDLTNCNAPQTSCTLTISDVQSKNVLWTNTYSCPCSEVNYSVACNGCHPGQLQCACEAYPGYCCIDCGSIESRLDNLIQVVKRLDSANGVTK